MNNPITITHREVMDFLNCEVVHDLGGVFYEHTIDDTIYPTQIDNEVACFEVFCFDPAVGSIELMPWCGFDFFAIDGHIGELVIFMRDGIGYGVLACDACFGIYGRTVSPISISDIFTSSEVV
ncbi:MAG: hypothetical protein AAFR81_27970 [Chloroflexota bacterium]